MIPRRTISLKKISKQITVPKVTYESKPRNNAKTLLNHQEMKESPYKDRIEETFAILTSPDT